MRNELKFIYIKRSESLPINPGTSVLINLFINDQRDTYVNLESIVQYFSVDYNQIFNFISDQYKNYLNMLFDGDERDFIEVGNVQSMTIFVHPEGVAELSRKFTDLEVKKFIQLIFEDYKNLNELEKPSHGKIVTAFKHLNELIQDSLLTTGNSKSFQLRRILKFWGELQQMGEQEIWLRHFLNDLSTMPLEKVYSIMPKYIRHLFNHQLKFSDIMNIIICIFGYVVVDHDKLKKLYLDNTLSIHKFKQPTSHPLNALAHAHLNNNKHKGKFHLENAQISKEERDKILIRILARKNSSCDEIDRNLSSLNFINIENLIKLPHTDTLLYGNVDKDAVANMNKISGLTLLFMEFSNRELYGFSNYIANIENRGSLTTNCSNANDN